MNAIQCGSELAREEAYTTYKYRWHPTVLNCASIYPYANINNMY
jgi:hypothetical protein